MWMPRRSLQPELMDSDNIPEASRAAFHRDLAFIHKLLGDLKSILQRLRRTPHPVRSVIDIGCGDGATLAQIRDAVGAEVTGIDLRPPDRDVHGVPILQRDATCDDLPPADVAISMLTLHHLTDDQVVLMIRNTARSCRRLICLDLVRHPLPFALFSAFIGPLIHREAADDGRQSIRRAFKPNELHALVAGALEGTASTFEHEVSRYYASQIIDIRFENATGTRP
jgi:2-polyprenyl-3-methyl-5-hydroxy-6-metoxy-1,4-benzoquinol methylase